MHRILFLALTVMTMVTSPVCAEEPENGGVPAQNREIIDAIGNLQAQLETLAGNLAVCPRNAPTRFTDNGDGTVCDSETGLMWEKKNGADGAPDLSNPRDVDNRYTWTGRRDYASPNGTLFTDFLPRLNGVIAASEASEQLGVYSDWRVPTSAELQTILDCSYALCIDTDAFGDVGYFYWSSTSHITYGGDAWCTWFEHGFVFSHSKKKEANVRAVRGGR